MSESESQSSGNIGAISRRSFMLTASAVALSAPFVRTAQAQNRTLRVLMWEPYVVPEVVAEFEKAHGVKFAPAFFDGNSEAYNKLRTGGTRDFELVQADGFWPKLYYKEGLISTLDRDSLSNNKYFLNAFTLENFSYLSANGSAIGVPFCWGAYGTTYNKAEVPLEVASSLQVLFDPTYSGRLSANARFEENIALAGILAATQMGTKDAPRPDGQPFNPYVLTDEELQTVEKMLIEQKRLLLTRYQDNTTLEQLFASSAIVAAPEFNQVFRKLRRQHMKGELEPDFGHVLVANEGGLGWVDSWLLTSGVTDPGMRDVAMSFIDMMISPETMRKVAETAGSGTTIDIRSLLSAEERELSMMDRTEEIRRMHMFDQPSSPEKWERVWSNMQAA